MTEYKDKIASILEGDDKAAEMIIFESNRKADLSLQARYPFLFHGLLAIFTNLLYPLLGLRRLIEFGDEDFVFVSCPDPIFRTKTLGLITGRLKYSIIYLPNFHVFSALRYHNYFKENGTKVFFPTIRLRHVLKAKKRLANFKKNVDSLESNIETRKLVSVLSSSLIYDEVVRDFVYHSNSFNGKWILEHDKFYFMPTVVNLHKIGEQCTMLQHGCFMEIDSDFVPLFCDKVLCCSDRERNTYISCGVAPERVMVFGAPLQTLGGENQLNVTETKSYSLLILLSYVNEDSLQSMKAVLSYVKEKCDSILVRMRPRSKKNDMTWLRKELEGMTISNNKNKLSEDIVSCQKVISFSEDANIEVIKNNKPFIYIYPWSGENRNLRHDLPYATINNYKDEINKLMEQDFYSSFSKEQYKEIVGETDVNVLRQRFEEYIRN